MSSIGPLDLSAIVHNLQIYGQNGYEEIQFKYSKGQEIPVLAKKPNWFSRLIRWIFQGGYQEASVIKRVVAFLETNKIHFNDDQMDLPNLKKVLRKRIKNHNNSLREEVKVKFNQLIKDTNKRQNYYEVYGYAKKIESLVQEKPSITPEKIENKSKKILAQVKTIIVKDDDKQARYSSRFHDAVDQALLEISRLKPGRKLLKRLLKSPIPVVIRLSNDLEDKMDVRFPFLLFASESQEKVYINLPRDYLTNQEDNRFMPDGYPIAIGLAHELIHVMHHAENKTATIFSGLGNQNLFHPHFDSLEEQFTICGMRHPKDDVEICENAFVQAFGYKFRRDHHGHPEKI